MSDSINIELNGREVSAAAGESLLTVIRDNGIKMPTLCDGVAGAAHEACDMCLVEVDGNLSRSCEVKVDQAITVVTESERAYNARHQAITKILLNHNTDCEAPCRNACPAQVDVQSYLRHISEGDNAAAMAVIQKDLPMARSIGRVCPAFCEHECRRSAVDDPLAIRMLKRHGADMDDESSSPYLAPIEEKIGKRVAIIGAGPGGLSTGYYLSHAGVDVDVFESMPEAGGWLRYGIPEYRLPKHVLDKEILQMTRAGMKLHTNTRLGRDVHLPDLQQQYDAVCLAIGAQDAVDMPYQGSDLGGVMLGVDYLRDFALGKTVDVGKRVAVIGGGNTAIDCARTALRQGAQVTIIYRRDKNAMPAEPYEIAEAEAEGVKFDFLAVPVENIADDNGRVCKIKIERLRLGEPDASGRRRPESTGEFYFDEFDTVIPAVSQKPNVNVLPGNAIPLTRWNTADVDPATMHTSVDTLFAIGDFRSGPATAVEAIADGRIAADSIMRLFRGQQLTPQPERFSARKAASLALVDARYLEQVPPRARVKPAELDKVRRLEGFDEVEQGLEPELAKQEAARCLECGCQKSERCTLRDCASEYQIRIDDETLKQLPQSQFAIDESSPFIRIDANRCISCGKCIDACRDQAGHNVLRFPQDNAAHRVAVAEGKCLDESQCGQCGICIQACPVGAITAKSQHHYGYADSTKKVDTICTYCGVGCGVTLHVDEPNNRVVAISGVEDSPVNQGMLCVKGRFGFDFIHSPERLTQPLIRKDGKLQPASWDKATTLVAEQLMKIRDRFGGTAIGALSSAKTTNEENYLLQKFVRSQLESNNIDHCARLCHASTVQGLAPTIGSGAMTNDIASIAESDLIVIIGSDTSSAHPIIASHIKQAVQKGAARLVVIDPRRIDMVQHAQMHLSQRPGTDVMLLNAVMAEIIKQGWQDTSYIEDRTEGYEALKQELQQPEYNLYNAANVTGISANLIAELARLIGTAKHTAIYYAMGITQHTTGTDNVRALSNLQLLCGNLGKIGAGLNPLRGQSNVQGACDMGALPNYLPGYQKVNDVKSRAFFDEYWQTALPPQPGLALTEMIDAMADGEMRALYVMGENPVLSDPDQKHVLKALEKVDFLVVQDIFLTETAQLADVVLPACSYAEKSGHFTNTERRVQRLTAAVNPPGEARQDWQIIQEIAAKMGALWHYQHPANITAEINQVTPSYAGITWQRTETESLHWPCPDTDHPGTPILHQQRFGKMERAKFSPVSFRVAAETPDEQFPLVLTTGRLLSQFHTGTMTRKTKGLDKMGEARAMISVADAERLGLTNGQPIRLATRRGEISVNAFITRKMQEGVVFMPFHFAEAAANVLTNPARDPEAKIPEFKVCAVRVDKIEAA